MSRRQQDKSTLNGAIKLSRHSPNFVSVILTYCYFYLIRIFQCLRIFYGFSNSFYVTGLPYILATIHEMCSSFCRRDNVIRSDNTVRVLYMESISLMQVTDALHGPIY